MADNAPQTPGTASGIASDASSGIGDLAQRIQLLRGQRVVLDADLAAFEFKDELVGMNLSKSYLPPIEKAIKATMERGAFAGYPMSNVKVIVYDGKEHEVDSKPVAFEIAGREAFKLALRDF